MRNCFIGKGRGIGMGDGQFVSIIIPNHNGRDFLNTCLSSLMKSTYTNFEVVVVDNGSSDGSIALVKNRFPTVVLVEKNQNLGYSGALNEGAKHAKGEYLLFLDNDTRVEPEWLAELVKTMENHPSIGISTSRILDFSLSDGKDKLYIGAAGGAIDILGFFFSRGAEDIDEYGKKEDVFFGVTSWLIRRAVFERVGRFDTAYHVFSDDVDLCWRVLLSGSRIVYVPTSVVYHYKNRRAENRTKEYRMRLRYMNERNYLRTLIKNLGTTNLFKTIFFYAVLKMLIISFEIFRREETLTSEIKGILSNLLHLDEVWKERRKVQKFIRKVPDSRILRLAVKSVTHRRLILRG